MLSSFTKYLAFATLTLLACGGCHRSTAEPLASLPVEKLDPVLGQTFANADQELRTEATRYVKAMENQDWPTAMAQLRELRSHRELTQEQRATLARAHQTTMRQLNESAEKGNESAAAVLSAYKANK